MKRYPMAHKIIIPEGTHRVRLDHTDVAATIKRVRKEQAAALGGPVPVKTLPALVAPELKHVGTGHGVIHLTGFSQNMPKGRKYRKS